MLSLFLVLPRVRSLEYCPECEKASRARLMLQRILKRDIFLFFEAALNNNIPFHTKERLDLALALFLILSASRKQNIVSPWPSGRLPTPIEQFPGRNRPNGNVPLRSTQMPALVSRLAILKQFLSRRCLRIMHNSTILEFNLRGGDESTASTSTTLRLRDFIH
jgi:hypothetical protein